MAQLLSKKSLVEIIGVDYVILQEVGEAGSIKKFYYAGGAILLIFCCTFVSVFYAFDLMWHTVTIQLFLATVFSLTLGTIYVLLLQSFSKNPLPRTDKPLKLGVSNLSRAGFIFFIGFLIAKPLEILVLKGDADRHVERYKIQLISSYEARSTRLYQREIDAIDHNIRMFGATIHDARSRAEVGRMQAEIDRIEQTRDESFAAATARIQKSDFFLERIQFVVREKPAAWFICLLVVCLFGLPAVLIYSISKDNVYYQRKSDREKEFVLRWYSTFKAKYRSAFDQRYQAAVDFHEPYINPPFGIERPKRPAFKSPADFYKDFPDFA